MTNRNQNEENYQDYILRGHYKIIRLMTNNTGFGITYLAEDLDLPDNNRCVIKQLKRQRFSELSSESFNMLDRIIELFYRESEWLYRLGNHSQIPYLFARFEENNEHYLVQEYIDGNDLRGEITPAQPLDEPKTIKLLKEVLEILVFVHDNNCVHRDIKPENIIRRREDNKLVLIDFGAVKEVTVSEISSFVSLSESIRRSPTLIGTPPYSPQEQLNPNKPIVRYFNDIYAVGVIGIEALTGSSDINNWRRDSNTKVSNELARTLDKMTHQNHEQRYQNAREALQALKEIEKSMITKFWIWFTSPI